jgi:putative endonuclease
VFLVYIIKAVSRNWFYVGLTANIEERLEDHNNNKNKSTKGFSPFKLIFVQVFKDRKTARDFEKFLKVRNNKEILLDLVKPGWRNW